MNNDFFIYLCEKTIKDVRLPPVRDQKTETAAKELARICDLYQGKVEERIWNSYKFMVDCLLASPEPIKKVGKFGITDDDILQAMLGKQDES